jgi:hypothetical protein
MARRLAEAARLGARRAVVPVGTAASVAVDPALDLVEAPDVRTAARRALEAAACAA